MDENKISKTDNFCEPSKMKLKDFRNRKALKNFIDEHPDKTKAFIQRLEDLLNESYQKGLGKEDEIISLVNLIQDHTKVSQHHKDVFRNTMYEINQSLIVNAIHNFLFKHHTFPTIIHLAKETNLSRTTIYKHLKDGLYSKYSTLVNKRHQYLVSKAMEMLYIVGVRDSNANALKAYIELAGGLKQKQEIHINNNYIQINNLKVSKEEFDNLPPDTLSQIESLLKTSLNQSD